MISLIGNRPALQVGRHQVFDYDTAWLGDALRRAALAAERDDFPFIDDIRSGIVQYLELRCPLRLLPLADLFTKMRKMLMTIGCETIAEKLEPLAPPLTVSLLPAAQQAGNGFELAFFEAIRAELEELRGEGAEEIRFTDLKESARIIRGATKWDKHCALLEEEIIAFLRDCDREQKAFERPLRLKVESDR